MCNRDARCNCHCDSEWKIGDKVTNIAFYDRPIGVIVAINCRTVRIEYNNNKKRTTWSKKNLIKLNHKPEQEYMQIGKKYKSNAGNIVTCVGYDEETNRYVVKLSSGRYQERQGCLTYASGKTCWYEYKEPVVEIKYGIIHNGHSTHWYSTLTNPNAKATFTDDVLTNIEMLS